MIEEKWVRAADILLIEIFGKLADTEGFPPRAEIPDTFLDFKDYSAVKLGNPSSLKLIEQGYVGAFIKKGTRVEIPYVDCEGDPLPDLPPMVLYRSKRARHHGTGSPREALRPVPAVGAACALKL